MAKCIFYTGCPPQRKLSASSPLSVVLCAARHCVLTRLSQDIVKPAQASFEAVLVKIASAADPYPLPGCSVRQLVARCFTALYGKAETRSLFDTVLAFQKVAGELKPPENKDARVSVKRLVPHTQYSSTALQHRDLLHW